MTSVALNRNRIEVGTTEELAELLSVFTTMIRIRRFEEKLGQLVAMGLLEQSPCLARNKESVPACLAHAFIAGETITVSDVMPSVLLARGAEPEALFRNILSGQEPGSTGEQVGIVSRLGVSRALGDAMARARANAPTICWSKDEEWQDQQLEILREARQQKLPLICMIDVEINTQLTGGSASSGIPARLQQSGLSLQEVDGGDALALLGVFRNARDRAKLGEGPIIIVVKNRRFEGHSSSRMSGPMRSLTSKSDADPVLRTRARVMRLDPNADAGLRAIESASRSEISSAAANARKPLG